MRSTALFLVLFGRCSNLVGAYHGDNLLSSSKQHQSGKTSAQHNRRILSNMMMPGDRVSAIGRDNAICAADYDPDQDAAIKRTVINYYYAIESSDEVTTDNSAGRAIIRMLEDKLFRAIRPAILWCYFDEPPSAGRNLLGDSSFSQQGMVMFQLVSLHKLCISS